jgi:glycosyltransferase involved in cell wall biosynthesis
MLKVDIISFSINTGGAGIAANSFKNLLLNRKSKFDINLITQDKAGKYQFLKRLVSYILNKFQFDGNPTKHSLNFFSYNPVLNRFKHNSNNISHIHWINNETLSIFDLHKIPRGSIITLHDEWFYCGSEHYYNITDESNDFINGYKYYKKGIKGIHWNYLIWKVKHKKLTDRKDLIYTVPSSWMLQRAQSSKILKNSDIRLLPNPIDTEKFISPTESCINSFKSKLNINNDSFVIVYGAISGNKNKLKGIDLLTDAVNLLKQKILNLPNSHITVIDFGGLKNDFESNGFRAISLGHINDSKYLANLYSSADCVVVPSKVEAFGQVAAEALSCETPVISFDTSGLKDIVKHNFNGLVAKTFSAESLFEQLLKMIQLPEDVRLKMGKNGRQHILKSFSKIVIKNKYIEIMDAAAKLKKV